MKGDEKAALKGTRCLVKMAKEAVLKDPLAIVHNLPVSQLPEVFVSDSCRIDPMAAWVNCAFLSVKLVSLEGAGKRQYWTTHLEQLRDLPQSLAATIMGRLITFLDRRLPQAKPCIPDTIGTGSPLDLK